MEDREQVWRQRLADLAASGETQTAFCEKHGFSRTRLRIWAKRLRSEPSRDKVQTGPLQEKSERPTPPPTRPYTKRTDAERRQILDAAAKSGLPLDTFARVNGFSQSMLYHWRRWFDKGGKLALNDLDVSDHAEFASVCISQPRPEAPIAPGCEASDTAVSIEIMLANGRAIKVSAPMNVNTIAALAAALERQP